MGTRADFYAEPEPGKLAWLGSIAWDGYPSGVDESVLKATDAETYQTEVAKFLKREDGTTPDEGWPWPWEDSRTTDYAYLFRDGKVFASSFGYDWFVVDLDKVNGGEPMTEDGDHAGSKMADGIFPDMTDVQNVTYGKRSGLLIF